MRKRPGWFPLAMDIGPRRHRRGELGDTMNGRRLSLALAAIAAATLLHGPAAGAACLITGSIQAAPNTTQPGLGAWQYTLSASWDTGTRYALSHLDLLISHQGGSCNCENLGQALHWSSPIGASDGEPGACPVAYEGYLDCTGDPSIGIDDMLLKFEPVASEDCEPGTTGTGTFAFFSDYPPAPISEPNLFLVDKYGQLVCYGLLAGVFPGLPCDPTATETGSWGAQKATYR